MQAQIENLCQLARDGSVEAASELLKLHYERIFAFLRRLCGSEPDACDLTQKTFCKAWAGLASYGGRASFSTWLHGIAHHVYADWRRKGDRLCPQTDEWWLTCPAADANPFEDLAERDLAMQLYKSVDQLEEQIRETVHLHYYQGLTLQETADAMGVAGSTVKYRLRGAMDSLRQQLIEKKQALL